MDCQIFKLPISTEGEICNLYSPKYNKVIELMTNNSLEKRTLGSDYLFIEFIKYLRMNNTISPQMFQIIKPECIHPVSYHDTSITLASIIKPRIIHHKTGKLWTNIFHKTKSKNLQQIINKLNLTMYIKKLYTMVKWDLSQIWCSGSTLYNQLTKEEKSYDHNNRCRKIIWRNPKPMHSKKRF